MYLMACVLCFAALSDPALAQYDQFSEEKEEVKEITEEQRKQEIKEAKEEAKTKKKIIEWQLHKSVSEIFDTKFPRAYKYNVYPFQFNQDTVAMSAEILSSLDGDLTNSKDKSVLIKAVHTWGEELSLQDMKSVIERTARRYASSSKDLEVNVVSNEDIDHKGFLGKDIYITYHVEDEKYGLRIRVFTTNYAKVEQVLSGPANTMYSYRSDDFFNSLTLYDGIVKLKMKDIENGDAELGYGWVDYTSKNNVFTVKLPPINKDYSPLPPTFKANTSREIMRYQIVDPVMEQKAYYNVFMYKKNAKYGLHNVKNILLSNHIARFVDNAGNQDNLNTQNSFENGVNFVKTRLVISPIDSMPDINTIIYEARYKDDTLIVQEFLCNVRYADSGLSQALFKFLKFHPSKYTPFEGEPEDVDEEKKK